MRFNICIEGTPEEVNEVIGGWKESSFIEAKNKLTSLENQVKSLKFCQEITDATIYNLKTGKLKIVGAAK